MRRIIAATGLFIFAMHGTALAQCMEIDVPDTLDITLVVPEIVGLGVSYKFYYGVSNPNIQDEMLTIHLAWLEHPETWNIQFCESPVADPPGFCRPIQPWETEFTISDTVYSEQTTLYDTEFFARSFGTGFCDLTLTREFCPEESIHHVLSYTLEQGTGIEVAPLDLELSPPWPNPFNPVTHIPFHLDAPGAVRVEIHDLAGRLVAVPLAGSLPAGMHEALFDGSGLPSGRYLVRVLTERSSLSAPLTLIK